MSGRTVDTSDSSGGSFHTLDVTRFRQAMARLHEQVATQHGRVEVTRRGCDDVCVMISKTELESLERALEILSETDEFKAMCQNLSEVAAVCLSCAPA